MNATGSPSSSAIMIRSSKTNGFSFLPTSSISGWVSGTKPQLSDHASLRIARMIAASSSKRFDLLTLRMRIFAFFSPAAMMRWTSGGKPWVMSSS
jgi:hypothetical protein